MIWPALLPIALLMGWQDSVFFVLLLSLYANFASDISAWQASKAREAVQDSR